MSILFGAVIWRPLQVDPDREYELPLVLPNMDPNTLTPEKLEDLQVLVHRPSLRYARTANCTRHIHTPCIRDFRCQGFMIETAAWLFAQAAYDTFGVNVDVLFFPDPNHMPEAFIRDIFECKAAA